MRTAALVLVPVVVVGLVSRSAEAECAMPSPAMLPDGATLPPNPVLYRFALAYGDATALRIEDAAGRAVPFTVKDVSVTAGIRVEELRIAAARGSFTVHGTDYELPHTYTIAARAAHAAHVAPVVSSVNWTHSSWMCSHETGFFVEARGEGVVAFRVAWNGGTEALVPANDRYFWMREMGGEWDPAALRAFVGHPNCVADLIPTQMIGRGDFRLFAKYADGSELEVELPRESVEPQAQAQAQPQAQPQPQPQPAFAYRPRETIDPWKVAVATAVSIAALISVSTLLVARRRRRNGTMVP